MDAPTSSFAVISIDPTHLNLGSQALYWTTTQVMPWVLLLLVWTTLLCTGVGLFRRCYLKGLRPVQWIDGFVTDDDDEEKQTRSKEPFVQV